MLYREVTVLRLICKNTVEENILQCAEAKLKLGKDLSKINGTEFSSALHAWYNVQSLCVYFFFFLCVCV